MISGRRFLIILSYFYSDPKYLLHCGSIYNYVYSLKS